MIAVRDIMQKHVVTVTTDATACHLARLLADEEIRLPDTSGWLLLIGQPPSMLALLLVGWRAEVAASLRQLLSSGGGRASGGRASAPRWNGVRAARRRESPPAWTGRGRACRP